MHISFPNKERGKCMGNVLKMDKVHLIQGFLRLNLSDRAIKRQTGIHRDTISKYRKQFQNGPQVPADLDSGSSTGIQNGPKVPTDFLPVIPSTHSAAIQPHAAGIREKVLRGLTAQRIYQDLVEDLSFSGSYDSVKRYVRKLRKRHPQYFERLPTYPGREVQVDFTKSPGLVLVNGRWLHPWLFKMTLSHSRHSYEEHVLHQDIETFIRCHEHGFKSFGGVAESVKLDNIKAAVLLACLYDPQLNPTYAAFAEHWGFVANPCAPYKPNHKGRVERDIQYTQSNALADRRFQSLEESNIFLKHWNKRWARTRIHGTVKCQVWKMFVETEQRALRPLADRDFPFFHVAQRKVDVTGLVCVGNNFYAAPHRYIGIWVSVHYNSDYVKILDDKQQLLITHKTLTGKGKFVQPHSCLPPYKHPSLEHQEFYYCKEARIIGPACLAAVEALLHQNHPLSIRRVRGVLSLAKRFPHPVLDAACTLALQQHLLHYHNLVALCQLQAAKGPLQNPPQSGTLTQNHDLIRPISEYQTLVEERTL